MSLALTLAPATQATVGRPVTVTGTGFTTAGAVDLKIYGAGVNISITPRLTASGGAITTVGHVTIVPWQSGKLYVEAHDITAGTKVVSSVRVSASA